MTRHVIAIGGLWMLLLGILAVRAPGFFAPENLRDMAITNAPALVVSIGMTLVILAGEIDVSIGSQFAVLSVVAGILAKSGLPLPLVAFGTLASGTLLGSVNGLLVTAMGIPSIVATLAAMAFWRELLRWTTQGAWVEGIPATFQWMGLGQTGGELAIVGSAAILFAVTSWVMGNLKLGRAVYAVGSRRESARLAGIPISGVTFGVFALMGAFTALAAFLDTVRFTQVQSSAGVGLELKAISAVVIGGTSITGGKGSLRGTLMGAVVLAAIAPALTFLGVNAFWEKAIQGAIILAAVVMERAAMKGDRAHAR